MFYIFLDEDAKKINSITKRFKNLTKDKQKKLLEEIIKVISNLFWQVNYSLQAELIILTD